MQIVLLNKSIQIKKILILKIWYAVICSNFLSGNSTDLFKNRKERGSELVITRITMVLGVAFFIICLVASFM